MPRRFESPQNTRAVAPGVSVRDRILQAAKRLFASQGYENTSTVSIARLAATSESQLMKHYGSKRGLLEAIFDQAWQRMIWAARQEFRSVASPAERLNVLVSLVMNGFEKDSELKQLMLLEGRRIRPGGQMVVVTQGFQEFVRMLDGVLEEMRDSGEIRADLHLEAVRSALMGALEGLLRDQLLGRTADYPAHYTTRDLRETFNALLVSFATRPAGPPQENRGS